ncbi:MAG: AAA family ATPase [Nitrospinota bacterium]
MNFDPSVRNSDEGGFQTAGGAFPYPRLAAFERPAPMKVEKVRINNFQCIQDSGEIPLDDHMTVLIGKNESGKTATLKALSCFNVDQEFDIVDVTTESQVRWDLEQGRISGDQVEMVSILIRLPPEDLPGFAPPPNFNWPETFKIVKTFDNEYKVLLADGEPLWKAFETQSDIPCLPPRARLVKLLEDTLQKVRSVYCGRVKRKYDLDYFVFLERHKGEPADENIVLFKYDAGSIWDSFSAKDWVQVTKIAPPYYGRNKRALNVGLKFDIEPYLAEVIEGAKSDASALDEKFPKFEEKLRELPPKHPLQEYLGEHFRAQLKLLRLEPGQENDEEDPNEEAVRGLAQEILRNLPRFVYVAGLGEMSDTISLDELGAFNLDEGKGLLRTCIEIAGLDPESTVRTGSAGRIQILDRAQKNLSKCLSEFWGPGDLVAAFDFWPQGRELTMRISCGDSNEALSRRSQGFVSFVGLFAKLSQLAAEGNVVALLDDPGLFLHPVVQKNALRLLGAQPYQIVLATHLPFLIDSSRLERVRVCQRGPNGTKVIDDWAEAGEALLPVWGTLFGGLTGKVMLVGEKRDEILFTALNAACRAEKKEFLGEDVVICPGNGSTLPYMAREFYRRRLMFVTVLGGDIDGKRRQQKMLQQCEGIEPTRVITLDEFGFGDIETHGLFSQEFRQRFQPREKDDYLRAVKEAGCTGFDNESLDNFARVFKAVKEGLRLTAETLTDLRAEHPDTKAQGEGAEIRDELIDFQTEHPDTRTQSEDAKVRDQLEVLFNSTAYPAYSQAEKLFGRIVRRLLETSDDNRNRIVGVLLNRFIIEADRPSQAQLQTALRQNGASAIEPRRLQRLFGDYFEKYQWIAEWIHRGGELIDFQFPYEPTYLEWRDEDKRFLEKLEEIVAREEFYRLRKKVLQVGWGEEFRNRVKDG